MSIANVNATLVGCIVEENNASLYGGGLFVDEGIAALHLVETQIGNNVAQAGSQMHNLAGGEVEIRRDTIFRMDGAFICYGYIHTK